MTDTAQPTDPAEKETLEATCRRWWWSPRPRPSSARSRSCHCCHPSGRTRPPTAMGHPVDAGSREGSRRADRGPPELHRGGRGRPEAVQYVVQLNGFPYPAWSAERRRDGRRTPLYGWLTADAISLTGTRVSMIALPWFVLVTTGSATKTGMVALAEMLPMVLLKVLGGPVIDRLGPPRHRRLRPRLDRGRRAILPCTTPASSRSASSWDWSRWRAPCADPATRPSTRSSQRSWRTPACRRSAPPAQRRRRARVVDGRRGLRRPADRRGRTGERPRRRRGQLRPVRPVLLVTTASFRPVAPDADDTTPAEPYREQLREGWRFLRRDRALRHRRHGGSHEPARPLVGVGPAPGLGSRQRRWCGGDRPRPRRLRRRLHGRRPLRGRLGGPVVALPHLPGRVPHHRAPASCSSPPTSRCGWSSASASVGGFASGFLNPVLGAVIFERIPAPLVGCVSSLITAMCFAPDAARRPARRCARHRPRSVVAMLAVGIAYFAVTMLPGVDPRWREMDRRPEPAAEPVSA